MIYLYSGTPGSGKSLHMAQDIYWWIKRGHTCIANFDIDISKISKPKGQFIYLDNMHLNPDLLIKFSAVYFHDHKFKEGDIRLYIDESQLLFNAREWNAKGRKEWLSFFTQHRKYGYDVFLVAQFDKMIDKQIRSLIEYEYIHRKVKNFGALGQIMNAAAGGGLIFAVKRWYPIGERVGTETLRVRRKYFELYDTLDTFNE